jgi:hypothetical protein
VNAIVPLVSFGFGFGIGFAAATLLRGIGGPRRDVVVSLLGLLILVLVGYSTFVTHRTAECQEQRNTEFEQGLEARAAATRAATQAEQGLIVAQRQFLAAVAGRESPEARTAAFADYNAALDRATQALEDIDRARAENPVIPDRHCGVQR